MSAPERILGLFIKDNPALVAAGKTNTMLAFAVFPVMPIMILNMTLFQAMGKALPAGVLAISRQLVLFVPAVLILPFFMNVRGVWVSLPLVDGFVTLISIFITVKLFASDLSSRQQFTVNS